MAIAGRAQTLTAALANPIREFLALDSGSRPSRLDGSSKAQFEALENQYSLSLI